MDSIFPGLGVNPFNTKPLVNYFNTARKAEPAKNPVPPAPATTTRQSGSDDRPVSSNRGRLIDYLA
jgi:hypothetical protein